jgi:hypothetical protein
MDSLPLAQSVALKLVEVYQLTHGINHLQQNPINLQWRDYLFCGQIVEQKVANIFDSTTTKIFQDGLKDLLDFIDERLAFDSSKYPDNTDSLKENLLALKNTIIQIQDQSKTENV